MIEANQQFITVGGLNFRVLVAGELSDKPPILLLHGFPDTLEVWNSVLPILVANGRQVIAFDQRGCGQSDILPNTSDYLYRTIVDDAIAVMNHLGFDGQFDVVGHDWGAVIAWGVALYHPDRVHRLVAVSVGHPQAYGRSGPRQTFGKGFYTVWFQLRRIAEWYLLSGGGFSRWLKGHPDPDEVMARMQDRARLKAGLSWYRANLISALTSQYPRCTVPTLGIWSDGDNFLEESQMLDSARYVDAPWQYHRVDGCGHWIPLEKAEDLAETILQWIEQPTLK